jgi:multiple sugar transport system substrate-binding protein
MIIASLLPLMLAACGNAAGGDESAKGGEEIAKAKTLAPAEMNVYDNSGASEEWFNEKYGNYMRTKFPQHTFQFVPMEPKRDLSAVIARGQQIDLFIDSIGQVGFKAGLIDTKMAFDVTALTKEANIDLGRFEPATLEAIKKMGGLYGLPIKNGGLAMYYNKDIFNKFGVTYPKDGMTWEEVAELSKKLTRNDGGQQYVGYTVSTDHLFRMNSLSLPLIDPASQKAALGTDAWKKLINATIVAPMQIDGAKAVIAQMKNKFPNKPEFSQDRNVAMFVFNYGFHTDSSFEGMNWDVVSLPVFKDQPKVGTQPYPNYMFVTATSKVKPQVMEVIKAFTSDEYQKKLSEQGEVTVLKSEEIKKVFGSNTPFKDKNLKNAVFYNQFATPSAKTVNDNLVTKSLRNHALNVIMGKEDMNTALREAGEEVNKALEESK